MQKFILILAVSLLTVSCVHTEVARKKTVREVLTEVESSGESDYRKRVVITGWVVDGFECSIICSTRPDLGSSFPKDAIWLTEPPPIDDTSIEDSSNHQYTYQIFKATVVATAKSSRPFLIDGHFIRSEGHMGAYKARLVDINYKIESQIEKYAYKWRAVDGHTSEGMTVDPFPKSIRPAEDLK